MPSPQISFRLSPYQLARGLKIIRTINPNYTPTSLAQLIKALYIDYISKTSFPRGDEITEADIVEISLINTKTTPMSLTDFQSATNQTIDKHK